MNLLMTLLFGLTILIGTIIILISKNNKKINEFSISISFSVLIFLIFLEIIPETLEFLKYKEVLFFTLIGLLLLKILDLFIPDHDHTEKKSHVFHIGIMACIALILHNLIEGMALYTSLSSGVGILLGIGVGLHNIPMGMVIGSTLKEANCSNFKVIMISLGISLATFIGGFMVYLIGDISNYVLGIMLAITLGMLLYIVFFELLEHLHHQDKKNNVKGFIIGAIIFILSMILGH
ncbi:MAG: ZIP family metal transporter [Bacilli bacterium]